MPSLSRSLRKGPLASAASTSGRANVSGIGVRERRESGAARRILRIKRRGPKFSTAAMFIRHIFISGLELNFYKVSLWSANRAGAHAL
jgi:hypothetical protein